MFFFIDTRHTGRSLACLKSIAANKKCPNFWTTFRETSALKKQRERERECVWVRETKEKSACVRERESVFLLKRGKERECVGVRVRNSSQVSKRECERDREK